MDPLVFKGMKVCVSTPMYRQEACSSYHNSRWALQKYFFAAGIAADEHKVCDTYLDRARNILAAAFLQTDATHQLLLDSDMGFAADDVMRMLYHAAENDKIWIIGAPYPYKEIDWERVKRAVLKNPEITADQLAHVAPGKWTWTGLPEGKYDPGLPIQLTGDKAHIGTGVMLVSRKAYEAMGPHCESYFDQRAGMRVTRYFRCEVVENEFRGEDVWFCRDAMKSGVKLWLAPWVKTEHWGPFCFRGDLGKVIDAGIEVA